ncbi:MAG TPA: Blp family class II bacteriocin [Kofleriaceae bacterium]|nr:Blp family class II bacteriocin [Kofleriaceae bacterium]
MNTFAPLDLDTLHTVTGGVDAVPQPKTTGQQIRSTLAACGTGAAVGAVTGGAIGALTTGGPGVLPGAGLGAVGGCVRGMIGQSTPAY